MYRDRMRIFAYDGENAVEYPPLTYAEQLVDFLEIDMTPFRKAVNNLKSYDGKDLTTRNIRSGWRGCGRFENNGRTERLAMRKF